MLLGLDPGAPGQGSDFWALTETHCAEEQSERGGEEAPLHLYLLCSSSLSLFFYPELGRLYLKGGPPWEETVEPGQNGGAGMPRCVAGQTDLSHSFTWSTSGPPGRATDFLCLCFISSVILSLFSISNICSSLLFALRQPHGSSFYLSSSLTLIVKFPYLM